MCEIVHKIWFSIDILLGNFVFLLFVIKNPFSTQVNGECDEPKIIRDEVSRLNKIVLEGFVKLLGELVDNPSENKKFRDDLSFNLFLMLQECNKFREHQGRETMIETLEKQLEEKQKSLNLVRGEILNANEVLKDLSMSV